MGSLSSANQCIFSGCAGDIPPSVLSLPHESSFVFVVRKFKFDFSENLKVRGKTVIFSRMVPIQPLSKRFDRIPSFIHSWSLLKN